jgi:hypothetical protein
MRSSQVWFSFLFAMDFIDHLGTTASKTIFNDGNRFWRVRCVLFLSAAINSRATERASNTWYGQSLISVSVKYLSCCRFRADDQLAWLRASMRQLTVSTSSFQSW